MSKFILVHDICCSSKLGPHLRILSSSVKVHHSIGYDVNVCRGEESNPRTPSRQDPESSAVDQTWLPPHGKRVNSEELEHFRQWLLSEKRIAESTARLYSQVAGKALRQIGRANPSLEDVKSYREAMRRNGNSASSRFNTLTALQHWFGFNGYEVRFKKPKRQRKSPTYLTESEASRLLEACRDTKERAIVSVLLYSGLRVSELCALDKTDIDFEDKVIHVRNGKGNSDEYVAVDSEALRAVRTLLKDRDDSKPFLFPNRRGNRYTRKGIERIVRQCAERARIAKHVTPHVLRHTLATNLLKNGCSLPFIQQQLRHKQIETTMVYLHSDKEMLKKAYERHKPRF